MNKEENQENPLAPIVIKLNNIIVVLVVFVIALLILLAIYLPQSKPTKKVEIPAPDEFGNFTEAAKQNAKLVKDNSVYWHAPNETELNDNPKKDEILYGKDLIAHTADYFGPKGKVFIGSINGMNCQNCHLEAGTKVFGNNYSAVSSTYPKFRARSGAVENIYKRVNDCFERSLNGKALDTTSKEMKAIVSYINWIGKDVVKGKKPEGSGFKDITFLDRAADSDKGKEVYILKCQSCHQSNGLGTLNGDKSAYTYPPLWGPNSYNDGAGLYRLSNFAKYVKYNMPLGVSHNEAQLSDEEAWDVAAFVNSQPRPKKDLKNDWPKIEEKPFDHPFGPYKDGFSEEQHKYGPFKQIKEKQEAMKKQKKA
ncbi:MAG: c-type cytochrome [Bacteroidota bacterium]|nr:c-type cytochrome [Bacteroidota bacterium]MDP3145835.1 c-type cytochrome [Bacteroidota bacterium]MDP3558469.1 c-type cytochrome [Bacteroidota bacterium]